MSPKTRCRRASSAESLVRAVGIEPTIREERVFETRASTCSATPAHDDVYLAFVLGPRFLFRWRAMKGQRRAVP